MKVKAWVEVEQEVEVEVSIAAMFNAIDELAEDDHPSMILNAISRAYGVLRKVPDKAVAAMNDSQRKLIREALREQAQRYESKPTAQDVGTAASNSKYRCTACNWIGEYEEINHLRAGDDDVLDQCPECETVESMTVAEGAK